MNNAIRKVMICLSVLGMWAGIVVQHASAQQAQPESPKPKQRNQPQVLTGNGDGNSYYWITMKGTLAEDLSVTPFRKAVADARERKADVLIIELDSQPPIDPMLGPLFYEYMNPGRGVDEVIFMVEPIAAVLTNEVPMEWERMPRIVFWVKMAVGGIAILPMVSGEIYFHSKAVLGGLGGLSEKIMGDDWVTEKQRSLRLGHLEGLARAGGYDPLIIRAMTRGECQLKLTFDKLGKAGIEEIRPGYKAYLEPTEELLSDDNLIESGRLRDEVTEDFIDGRKITAKEIFYGRGNDYLTLDSRRAGLIGVSKGEVDTKEQLLEALGLLESGRELSSGETPFIKWRRDIEAAQSRVIKIQESICSNWLSVSNPLPGDPWKFHGLVMNGNERVWRFTPNFADNRGAAADVKDKWKKYASREKGLCLELIAILRKSGEGFTDQFKAENQVPTIEELRIRVNSMELLMLLNS